MTNVYVWGETPTILTTAIEAMMSSLPDVTFNGTTTETKDIYSESVVVMPIRSAQDVDTALRLSLKDRPDIRLFCCICGNLPAREAKMLIQKRIAGVVKVEIYTAFKEIKGYLSAVLFGAPEVRSAEFVRDYIDMRDAHLEEKSLTSREIQIRNLIWEGKRNGQIAKQLFLSVDSIKKHITTMYKKLGVRGRAELMQMRPPAST